MDGLNRVMLLGNLGDDPELRTAKTSVLKISLACTETWFDDRHQRQERTEWVRVVVFGSRAEGLAKILTKGDRIFVEGSLRTSSYEKDGEKRYTTEVIAQNVILSGGGRREGGEAPRSQWGRRSAPRREPEPRRDENPDDFETSYGNAEDIPF